MDLHLKVSILPVLIFHERPGSGFQQHVVESDNRHRQWLTGIIVAVLAEPLAVLAEPQH